MQTPENAQELDARLERLDAHKQEWAELPVTEKIQMARRLLQRTYDVAERQVQAAIRAKGIPPDSPLVGEEWLGGPLITMRTLRCTIKSLEDVAQGRSPQLKPNAVRTRPNGQVAVEVVPVDRWDSLMFADFAAEVWMQHDVTQANLEDTMAVFYKEPNPEGKVALVLGAGNVASIGPLDVVYKLFVEGQVCMLKMNPVNDYLGAFIEESFAEFIDRGFMAMAYGGADVGAYLCYHDAVEEIHITGSDRTHDAIVYGVGEEGEARKAADDRKIDKRMTSELGNVSPVIIMPGKWSKSDLAFQAENVATQLANNGAFNCNAARVLITHAAWPQREEFLDAVRDAFRRIPQRVPYYPGARERFETWTNANPERAEFYGVKDDTYLPWALVPGLDPEDEGNMCFSQESFCGVISETALDAQDVPEFLGKAVAFANDTLWGTLSASLIVDPKTERRYTAEIGQALQDLRFGSVVVNHWPALAYGFGVTTWGAYPGHTYQDIGSGIGVVHNAYMFDRAEKSVIRGPFRMFPKPPWFVTNKRTHEIARRLVDFELEPGVKNLARVMTQAVRG